MTSPTPQSPRLNSLVQTLAEAYLERGQFAEAVDQFSELVRNGLQTPNVYRNLALALLGMESLTAAAQQVYEYVLKIFPNDRELALKICTLLLKDKAQDAFALKCYQQTLALHPPPAREVLWGLAAHLQTLGYEPAAFEILKRMALRENGKETQTLAQLVQLAARLDKQNEARNILLYLEGRNERAHGVARLLALEYARTFLRHGNAHTLTTREWQTITQAALSYERLQSMSAAREYAILRLALARVQSLNAQRYYSQRAGAADLHLTDFLQRLSPVETTSASARAAFKHVYGLRLKNLAHVRAEAGETVARNLAQKFLAFAAKHLGKAAQATCYAFADGFLASADSLTMLAAAAVEVLHKMERYNLTAAKGTQLFAQTVVHAPRAASFGEGHAGVQVLYEMLHLLEAQAVQAEASTQGRNCLWFSREVYEHALGQKVWPAKAHERVHFAAEEFHAEVYEAVWRNPLEYVEEKTPCDWGRFVVHARLRGSRNRGTYRGRDRQLERSVIIRALSPALSAKLAQDSAQREHVLAAIRSLAKLEAPGIAAIYDMGFHEDIFFYAREYLEGQTLAEARQAGRGFTLDETLKLGVRVCRILSVAHRQGVVHGNLKPENVWLFPNDELKLSDFYVPGFVEKPEPANNMNLSSWRYAAPELFRPFAPNVQSDVYALGMMLYELLAGHSHLAEFDSAIAPDDTLLPLLSSLQPDVPPGLDEIFLRACHKNPRERYKNLFEFESALRRLLS